MKICSKCKIEYPANLEYFPPDKRRPSGLSSWCRICKKVISKKWRETNREKHLQANTEWQQKNNLQKNKHSQKWAQKNNTYFLNKVNERRAYKLKATFKDCPINKKQIKDFYLKCPNGLIVDHIAPLKGKDIHGFHVPWNLQYLTKSENSSKGNKFEPYIESIRGI